MTDLNAFLPYVNGPLGFLFRHALWIPDRRHRVAKIVPNGYHLALGGRKYRAVLYASNQHTDAAYKNMGWFMRGAHAFDMAARPYAPELNFGFDTFTSQPDETDGIDTYISDSAPTTSYGNSSILRLGENYGTANIARILIKFDLSSLPPSTFVANPATLSLWQTLVDALNNRTFRVYRQKRAWVETQATWNVYSTGNNWQTAGGFGTNDCEQTQVAQLTLTSSESNGEKQWSINKIYIQEMLDGRWTNNGFLMNNGVEDNDEHQFASSSHTTASERPKLEFEYYLQDSGGLLL